MTYTVAQNTSFLTIASVLQKCISSVYFIIIARTIGAQNTGDYFTIITSIAIFTVIADFGFTAVLTRESSKYPEKIDHYLRTVLSVKFLFGISTFLLILFSKTIFDFPTQAYSLVILGGFTMFFDNLQTCFYGALRAKKNLLYEAIGIIFSQATTLIIGTLVILNNWPLMWLIAAYTIPSFLINIYAALCLYIRYQITLWPTFDPQIFKTFLFLAWPFAVAGIVSRLFSYNDTIIMNTFLSQREIGIWAAAYKVAAAFQFIPITLAVSIFPAMSSLAIIDKEKIGELYKRSFHYLLMIAFPLGLGIVAIAEPLVLKFFKEDYQEAVPVLRLLMVSLVCGFISFINGAVLNASSRQKTQTVLMLLTLVVSVMGNLILIPRIGIEGAAITSVTSNLFLSVLGIYLVHRTIILHYQSLIKIFGQVCFSALIMSGVVYYLSTFINFLFVIPLGVLIYVFLLFLTKGITWLLIQEFKGKLFHKKNVVI